MADFKLTNLYEDPIQRSTPVEPSVEISQASQNGANDPLSSQQDDQHGKSGAFHPPRRRDARGRLLRSYTTAAQKKSEQQWYRTHKLRRLTIPMPIDLIARLKAEAAVTHETFWKLVSRLLTDALDREQTVPLESARSIEEMLP